MTRKADFKFYCLSFGCQMNAYDTEVIASQLRAQGASRAESPELADVIIVNTCSVREHAEKRAISRIINLNREYEAKSVVIGCMAQRLQSKLLDFIPGIDILAGTNSYKSLPSAIEDVLRTGGKHLLFNNDSTYYSLSDPSYPGKPARYLSITRGCDKFCSYCIVPYLRGRVRSKPPKKIINEINSMVRGGAREITLLGQNVMAYNYLDCGFRELLIHVVNETDVDRIRFLTTHPTDLSMDIFYLMLEHRNICPHIHLPVQSGSNRILSMMKRRYTREKYIGLVEKARSIVKDLAITTDIIVGFPTESDRDFQDTLDLVERIRFDAAFTFKYSPREGTKAADLDDDVSNEEKKKRLSMLNKRILDIRREVLSKSIGSTAEILIDGKVKKGDNCLYKGRTVQFRNVIVKNDNLTEGDLIRVKLGSLSNFTFVGTERS